MHPKDIDIVAYSYFLPEDRIALFPLQERSSSKLLTFCNGKIKDDYFRHFSRYVPDNSLIVFNDSKVIRARLQFKNDTNASIEIFCLEPSNGMNITQAMMAHQKVVWDCFVGNLKRFKQNEIFIHQDNLIVSASKIGKESDKIQIAFKWNLPITFAEVLEKIGDIPLPPYIKRKAEQKDAETYQTVYAKHEGSVAAPTAGLHFTKEVIDNLMHKNCKINYITLHVGAGTFKPVTANKMEEHNMHSEEIIISKDLLMSLMEKHSRIIAVGTTSLRTLESLYWIGIKVLLHEINAVDNIFIRQWDPYEQKYQIDSFGFRDALSAIMAFMEKHQKEILVARTQIIIAPGYHFKIVNGLVTNFHQPQSTLLLLIAAFVGDKWAEIYEHALKNEYRFLSYGDSSYLELKKEKLS